MSVARFPGLVPTGRVARQMLRGALIWGGVFALIVWELVNEFGNQYPTVTDRERLVATMGSDVGRQALFGPAHHLDTVAGYTAFHMIGVLGIIGGVWGLLASARLLRGEEEAGRFEVLLAGRTTRGRAAAASLAGLGVGLFVLWAVTAVAVAVFGRSADPPFSVSASLFAALTVVAPAAIFLAVGALCGQLAPTRRQAATWAASAFGLVYLLRVVAYSGTSLRWLFTWVGAAVVGASVDLPSLLAAGVNVASVGIFVLGVGTLVHGLAPRFVGAVAYGVVAWSFLVEIVGTSLGASHWLLDLSVLHHIARAPAVGVRWDSVAILIALGVVAAAGRMLAFARRDLKGA